MKAVNQLVILILALIAGQVYANQIPFGSYEATCFNIKVSTENAPYRLQALCADRNGEYVVSSLESFDNCYGDIENNNGNLTCNTKALPNNFYITCVDVTFNQRVLFALCQDRQGQYQATALYDFLACPSQIQNINGKLRCM